MTDCSELTLSTRDKYAPIPSGLHSFSISVLSRGAMFNNASIVINISKHTQDEEGALLSCRGSPRERAHSDPCLPVRLPSSGEYFRVFRPLTAHTAQAFIQREADGAAPKAVDAELKRQRRTLEILSSRSEEEEHRASLSTPSSPETSPRSRRKSLLDVLPSAFHAAKTLREASKRNDSRLWKAPEVCQLATLSILYLLPNIC